MNESARARLKAKAESSTWAAGTSATPEELESAYENYVVIELENGNDDYFDFQVWAELIYGIPND